MSWTRTCWREQQSTLLLSLFFLQLLSFVAFAAATTLLTVQTDCGPVAGQLSHGDVWAFQGIPYAAAPVGARRFQPSETLKSAGQCWNGTKQAMIPGALCLQKVRQVLTL
jgi:para-nitrobenzyl esterase